MVVGYDPNIGDDEEKDRILDRVGNGYRLYILEDLNGLIGDRTTGTFGVLY